MKRPGSLTLKQREAIDEARQRGGLTRRRDGWVASVDVWGHHSFQTVHSLVERGLLQRVGRDRVVIAEGEAAL